jgi:hypothetical protein
VGDISREQKVKYAMHLYQGMQKPTQKIVVRVCQLMLKYNQRLYFHFADHSYTEPLHFISTRRYEICCSKPGNFML